MFGISGGEFIVLLIVVSVVVGPEHLPEYAAKLAQAVRRLRVFLDDTKAQIAEEVGPELGDLNLSDLDPRNYDPRKIVKDALGEDLDSIRRDLANPIAAIQDTVKEAGTAADSTVAGVDGSRSSKSLKEMIDEKAEETRAAKAAASAPQIEAASAGAAEADGAQDSTADSEPVAAADEDAEPETPQDSEREGIAADAPAEESAATPAASADLAEEGVEDEERRALVGEALDKVAGVVGDVAGAAEDTFDLVPDEPADASAAAAAGAAMPSSLAEGPAAGAIEPGRPLSPRDIVRAANAAARTRREAATARLG